MYNFDLGKYLNFKKILPNIVVTTLIIFPTSAHAYVDPGISGLIFQIGFVIFYAIIGILAIFFRPIKKLIKKLKNKGAVRQK